MVERVDAYYATKCEVRVASIHKNAYGFALFPIRIFYLLDGMKKKYYY